MSCPFHHQHVAQLLQLSKPENPGALAVPPDTFLPFFMRSSLPRMSFPSSRSHSSKIHSLRSSSLSPIPPPPLASPLCVCTAKQPPLHTPTHLTECRSAYLHTRSSRKLDTPPHTVEKKYTRNAL